MRHDHAVPHEAEELQQDRTLLLHLLLELPVIDAGGRRVKYPLGQPSRRRYRREDYGWDPAFFVQSLIGVGEWDRAIEMMDAIAWKVRLAGRLPLVSRWVASDHTPLWRLRARRDDPRFAEVTQPPLIAQAGLHLANLVGPHRLGLDRLAKYAEAAQANVDWLLQHRIAPGRTLISVIDPIETGMDSLIAWDECLERILPVARGLARDFVIHHASAFLTARYIKLGWHLPRIYADPNSCLIEPVSFNVLVIRELLALGTLWATLGRAEPAAQAGQRAAVLLDALDRVAWCDRAHAYLPQARVGGQWRPLTTISVDSLYPLLLPELPLERVDALYTLLDTRFRAERLVPVSPVSARPRRRSGLRPRLWGPNQVWANTNMFVRDGLRHHARRASPRLATRLAADADRIDADWWLLKQAYRYREYYDQDGRGGGEGPFFWDCLRRTTFPITFQG